MGPVRRVVEWFDGSRRVVVLALVGWAVLVVLGAGRSAEDGQWLGVPGLDYLFYVFLALVAIGALMAVALMVTSKRERTTRQRPKRSWWWWVPLAIAALVFYLLDPELAERDDRAIETTEQVEPDDVGPAPNLGLDDVDLVALAFSLAAALAVAWWARRRLRAAPEPEVAPLMPLEQDVADAIDRATGHLLAGSDPRTAVLNAYATLERTLASRGESRASSETATEHLRRVLDSLPIDATPLVSLGELYERARFSTDPITQADQHHAGQALDRARHDLRVLT